MPTAWRQGDLVSPQDANALGWVLSDHDPETFRLVVASHSCDVACDESIEPDVELLACTVVPDQQATHRNGHSNRKLHLQVTGPDAAEWLEMTIRSRIVVAKADLLSKEPWPSHTIPTEGRDILRRWLAQRYSRSAFPDAFNKWLGECKVAGPLDAFGKKYSPVLRAVYFDLDDDSERTDPAAPYELGINLVYATTDAAYAKSAQAAATELGALIAKKCKRDGKWQWIELMYCDAVADTTFSLRAADTYRRWKFDHRSIDGEPSAETE